MTAVTLRHPAGGRRFGRGLLVAALLSACLGGGVLAVEMLNGNNPLVSTDAAAGGPEVHSIGDDISTSFGVVAVEHATAISGLNDQQVTGAHAVPGLVKEGTIDIQVAAVITNLANSVLNYQPTQFELIDKTGAVVPISKVPQLPGELQPNAAIDVLLDFVTTSEARPFTVRFLDPATGQSVLIGLGAVGCTVQGGTGRPLPVTGGCSEQQKSDHTHG
jgi:predicted DNA-binding protein with PD1-like motif